MNKSLLLKCRWLFIFGLAIMFTSVNLHAQAPTITYVTANNLTADFSKSSLVLNINYTGSCTGSQVRVGLPTGVTYAGGISKVSCTAALNVTYNAAASTAQSPVFDITGTIAPGNQITFSFDSVYVSGGCTAVSITDPSNPNAKNYNIYKPTLPITPAPTVANAFIGQCTTRTTTITAGGANAAIDTLRLFIVYPNQAVENITNNNAIVANGINFTPTASSGDTLFYKIFGATIFNGNNLFENGELVTISEPITVTKCGTPQNATIYGASWGVSPTETCEWTTATSSVTMASGVPAVTRTHNIIRSTDMCERGIYEFTITNTGTGGQKDGAMYNINQLVGWTASNSIALHNYSVANYEIQRKLDSVRIGSLSTNAIITKVSGLPPQLQLSQLTSDPDGPGVGLEDLDGDGQYDDLAPGQSFTYTVYDSWEHNGTCYQNANYRAHNSQTVYFNMCNDSFRTNFDVSVDYFGYGDAINSTKPSQITGGSPFSISYCSQGDKSPFGMATRDVDSTYLKIILPAGLAASGPTGGATRNGVVLNSNDAYTIPGGAGLDTFVVRYKGVNNYCIEIN